MTGEQGTQQTQPSTQQKPSPPGDDKVYDLLREKIKSKMEVAKLLGTFLTAVVGGILAFKTESIGFIRDDPGGLQAVLFYLGIMLVSFAIILFFATVIAYDRLLMPLRYWNVTPDKKSEAELKRLMVEASWKYFASASTCFAIGFPLLAYAIINPNTCAALLVALPCAGLALWLMGDVRQPGFTNGEAKVELR